MVWLNFIRTIKITSCVTYLFNFWLYPIVTINTQTIHWHSRVSSPFVVIVVIFFSTGTLNGEPGTSLPATSTVTLCGPVSVGANVVSKPSGVFLSGSSAVWFLGVVTFTVQGTSSPTGAVFMDTGRFVLTWTASGGKPRQVMFGLDGQILHQSL